MKLTIVVMFIASSVWACPKNYEEVSGVCAAMSEVAEKAESVKPLDEKVPSEKMPSYQRPGINAVMPKSLVDEDAARDKAQQDADTAGKIAAGLK